MSSDDLQKLLENAQPEETTESQKNRELIEATASRFVEKALKVYSDPLVHKAMVVRICNDMIAWHDRISEKMFDDNQTESAIAWAADKGKFQAMLNILFTINLGEDDWMTTDD